MSTPTGGGSRSALEVDRDEWRDTAYAARDHYEQSDARLAAVEAECERWRMAFERLSDEAHGLRTQIDKLNADYQAAVGRLRDELAPEVDS